MGACWARARDRGENVLSLRWHAGARVARAASGGGRRRARGKRGRRRVLKQRSRLRRARRRGYAIRRLGLRAWACVGRGLEIEVKCHWGGWRAREELAWRAATSRCRARGERNRRSGRWRCTRRRRDRRGGAEIRRLALGLGARRMPRSARARAADIEAACRRRVRSPRRPSTAVVGGGTSLRARDERKPIVALFSRHLFYRVRAQGGVWGRSSGCVCVRCQLEESQSVLFLLLSVGLLGTFVLALPLVRAVREGVAFRGSGIRFCPRVCARKQREQARGRGKPPSVRREQVDGHRTFPEEGPGVVGAVLPKDLPAFVDDPQGGNPFLVYPHSWAVFPAGRVTTRVLKRSIEARDEAASEDPIGT